jgi:hypothetical protein
MAGLPLKEGLNPVNRDGAAAYTGGFATYQTSVGAPAMFSGDPVAASPTGKVVLATSAGQNILGVAVGYFWVDPTSKTPVESNHKPASTSSQTGIYQGINFTDDAGPGVKVITDLNQMYAIKSTTSVPATALKDKIQFVRTGGNTTTGRSNGQVSISTPVSTDILRVEGVMRAQEYVSGGTVDNNWNVANTVVLVRLSDKVEL